MGGSGRHRHGARGALLDQPADLAAGYRAAAEEYYAPAATLDWNLWLGPAAERPYNPAYAPFSWRGWWDFGTGALGDMACHIMDAAFWALDLGYPTRVEPESTPLFKETAPATSRITY